MRRSEKTHGICKKCKAAAKPPTAKRRVRDAKDDTADDPVYLFCCDCPVAFAYGGGVPKSRCPECDTKHREKNPPKATRQRRYDETHGRDEIHATRAGALSAYLRSRNR